MTKYTNDIKTPFYNQLQICEMLSNIISLEKIRDKIINNKFQYLSFGGNSSSFLINPIGEVKISIIKHITPKTIKFLTSQISTKANM
ncbi:hypothetical protein [Candidatus Azobacteroides pseudotrichonymphae]|jgi:hypothetical protein|uniref:hypothetical protein n=1 Tax=Candidatus Azobacteroides pseudotrichonymphae TaxID=511435 RepID=UPI0003066A8B|nr:hypothetical protein [Candidatus Azobacteroides pseudotrichonymphae]